MRRNSERQDWRLPATLSNLCGVDSNTGSTNVAPALRADMEI